MINISKIKKFAEENYYLASILKDFTKYEADKTLIDEVLKIHYLARKVANLADDIYYEIIKNDE